MAVDTVLGTAPLAVLVSTPAFCQTAICGPVLDLFVAARDAHPDVTFVHVEVYQSASEVEASGPDATLAPAVEAWARSVAEQYGYTDVDHDVELFGRCAACTTADVDA